MNISDAIIRSNKMSDLNTMEKLSSVKVDDDIDNLE